MKVSPIFSFLPFVLLFLSLLCYIFFIRPLSLITLIFTLPRTEWIERVEREDPERHQLFLVLKVDSGHVGGLQENDIILTLNEKLVSRITDLDVMYNNSELDALVVRRREEMRIKVATVPTADLETDRVVLFCGAALQRPHHAVRQQISKVLSDVYVSARVCDQLSLKFYLSSSPLPFLVRGEHQKKEILLYKVKSCVICSLVSCYPLRKARRRIPTKDIKVANSCVGLIKQMPGSPARFYGLYPSNFITHVNGTPTPNLDSFLAAAAKIPDNTYFRMKALTFDNIPWVITMKKNEHYFPTVELVKDAANRECGWRKVVHEYDGAGAGETDGIGGGGGEAVGVDGDGPVVPMDEGREE